MIILMNFIQAAQIYNFSTDWVYYDNILSQRALERLVLFNLMFFVRIIYMLMAMVMITLFIQSPKAQKYYTNILITIIMIAVFTTFFPEEEDQSRPQFISLVGAFAIAAFTTVNFLVKLIQVFVEEREFLAKSIQEYHQEKKHAS